MPAAQRLHRSEDFKLAFRSGIRAGRDDIVVHMARAVGDNPTRAGLVVSKAVGNAVTRNKVKRRLRASLRTELEQAPHGSIVVVRALPGAASVDFSSLTSQLSSGISACVRKVQRMDTVR
ncbi:ribonuclease P protein component [Rarobacter incanus]|uniref:ribonuclease P protein component n=1 Tax=Rarobacter incanus TaxID=153494 RepID=UPI00248216E4|nr:ribonuclease P protein component [Rarobacter incanus]